MPTENEIATEYLPFAIRVARSFTWDPEAESIAGIAMLRAIRAYDESRSIPLAGFIAYCVKIDIYHYWRKVKVRKCVELKSEAWWDAGDSLASYDDEPELDEPKLHPELYRMLYDKYIDGWCIDVIARRYNVSIHYARYWIKYAVGVLDANR